MTATVGDLIDRILRDYLVPPDEQPTRFTLSSSLDGSASATTLSYSDTLLPIEVENVIGPGQVVEIGREQIIVGDVNPDTNQITDCIRGANGTEVAAHASGAIAVVSPKFGRQSLYEAVGDAITSVSPPLYALRHEQLTVSLTDPVEIPADYDEHQKMTVVDGTDIYHDAPYVPLIPYPASLTSKAIIFEGVPDGATAHLTYRARLAPPESENDLLVDDLGLDPSWLRIIEIDVVAQMMSGRDIEATTAEFLTQHVQSQFVPVGTGTRLREALIRYHEYLLDRAIRQLRRRDGTPQVLHGRVVG